MKRLFLYIILSLISTLAVYATVVVYSEFRVRVQKNYPGPADEVTLRYDETSCRFEILPGPDNIEIDYDRVPLYHFVQPSDTMKWDTFTGPSLLSVPEWQLVVKCGFEFVGFEDTGGQVEAVDCYFNIPSMISFKKNYTGRDISGMLTIRYNALRSDATSPIGRYMTIKYLQKAQPLLNPGSLPDIVYVKDGAESALIYSLQDASGGSESKGIQYCWEQWLDSRWVAVEGTGSTLTVAAPGHHSVYRRKAVSDNLMEYTNFCRISRKGCSNENYILKATVLSPGTDNFPGRFTEDIMYYDGLGRPIQQIEIGASPAGNDLIQPIEYDLMGRDDAKTYLPYAGKKLSGAYRPWTLTEQAAFYKSMYVETTRYTFSEKEYDLTPLNRVVAAWQSGEKYRNAGKKQQYGYGVNQQEYIFRLQAETDGVFVKGFWPIGSLQKETSLDEDGNEKQVYKDAFGQLVMERTYAESGVSMDTYYVYDDYGRVICIFTPEGVDRLQTLMHVGYGSDLMQDYCYVYRYNRRGRVAEKKWPGIAPEIYVYDGNGRVVIRQDGRMRDVGKGILMAYDAIGRLVSETLIPVSVEEIRYKSCFSLGELKVFMERPGILLAAYEYDKYVGRDLPFLYWEVDGIGSYDGRVKGMKTGEKVAILGGLTDSVTNYISRKFYYDDKKQLCQMVEKNQFGEENRYSYEYDWFGNVTRHIESTLINRVLSHRVEHRYKYDSRHRLLEERIRVDTVDCALLVYQYDELGRRFAVLYGDGVERMEYHYDLGNNLTSISSRCFSMNLRYDAPVGAEPCYNGNISEVAWWYTRPYELRYGFSYDRSGRLKDARYHVNGGETNGFSERRLTYDKNGNLLSLTRTSHQVVVDELGYTYRGNQLLRVEDAGGEAGFAVTTSYEYDQNGNMIKDQSRGLEFEYNVLNLPHREKAKDIVWEYAYDGTKLSVTEAKNSGYVYLGSCIYNRRLGNYNLESIVFSEGLITFDGTDYTTHYFLRDHLGSVRAVVNAASRAIEEQNDYYPFGARHLQSGYPLFARNRMKYNGKEEQTTGGLSYLDYGVRMYDPAIGRWLTADPKSESYYSLSSYTYCSNNPINAIDPDGTYTDWIRNRYGDYLWDDYATSPETTRDGWEYVGKDLPENADRLDILTEKQGKLYYKNTSNLFASVGNLLFGKGTFVEHKAYNPAKENFTGDLVGMSTWTVGGAAVMKGVKWGIARNIGGWRWVKGGMAKNGVQLGSKLDYILGKATGSAHNIERSTGMLRQLESVGIFDNSAGRSLLQNHLKNIYTGTKGLVQSNGYYLRESLLMGPRGGLKMESIWEGNKLITVKLIGGK